MFMWRAPAQHVIASITAGLTVERCAVNIDHPVHAQHAKKGHHPQLSRSEFTLSFSLSFPFSFPFAFAFAFSFSFSFSFSLNLALALSFT